MTITGDSVGNGSNQEGRFVAETMRTDVVMVFTPFVVDQRRLCSHDNQVLAVSVNSSAGATMSLSNLALARGVREA